MVWKRLIDTGTCFVPIATGCAYDVMALTAFLRALSGEYPVMEEPDLP